jgi:hypothetical protein
MLWLAVFPVLFNTYAGITTVDARLVEAVRAFGGTPRQIFFKVTVPSSMESLEQSRYLNLTRRDDYRFSSTSNILRIQVIFPICFYFARGTVSKEW